MGSGNGAFVTTLLSDVAVIGSQVWAVGYRSVPGVGIQTLGERLCPVLVLDSAFSPKTVTVTHGQTVAWSFPATNDQSHSVTDKTAMGLFDSGTRAPGSSFTFTFTGAGTYPVIDQVTSNTGTVKSKMTASPPSGGPGTQFTIAWASATPPAGFVFNVQIRRPDSGTWVDWKNGVTSTSATFVPDAGTGAYSFRAKLRKTSNGSSSNWSPVVSIQVS